LKGGSHWDVKVLGLIFRDGSKAPETKPRPHAKPSTNKSSFAKKIPFG
jgi:hypothetical protein